MAPTLRRIALPALTLLLFFLACGDVAAQGEEQVTELTITDPQGDQGTPFRTNRSLIQISFQHNGSTGSYFINTRGADVEGSTVIGPSNVTQGSVSAGLNTPGTKNISLTLFQSRLNVLVQTLQPLIVQFDNEAPVITIQTVTLGDSATPVPFTGQTFTTNAENISIRGTVTDPNNGSPPGEITLNVTNQRNSQTTPVQVDATGTFEAQVPLSGLDDGEILLDLVAEDTLNDPGVQQGNRSDPLTVRVVRDTTVPVVRDVQIIRFPNDAQRREIRTPGRETFVGNETIQIQVTVSEPLASPPQVQVQQTGGQPIPATLVTQLQPGQNLDVFLFQYSVIAVEAQNGPASVAISGSFDGNGPNPDFGFDPANNPIDPAADSSTIAVAFVVDTVPPDLLRGTGVIRSVPADGQLVGRDDFPSVIQVFVDDFNTSNENDTATDRASGVDFERISVGGAGATTGLNITLRGPRGDIPGTVSVAPPNGLFLNLPDFTRSENQNPNFSDRDGDGVPEPEDGLYTVTVSLIDKVDNASSRTVNFTVDTVPVSQESIRVDLEPPAASGNPLGPAGNCIGLQTGEFPTVRVSSSDPQFSVTGSQVEFFSQIAGANSVPVKFDADLTRSIGGTGGTTPSITLTNIRKPGENVGSDSFPNPQPAPPTSFVPPGSLDPRTGANDGVYIVRVTPRDIAGNEGTLSTTNGQRRDFVEFRVQLDNTDPFVESTTPPVDEATSGPLITVEGVINDPMATNGNKGCGVDINATDVNFRLEAAYRPNEVNLSFIDDPNPQLPFNGPARIRSLLKFVHIPNPIDPTRNDFNPLDDRFRAILEIIDDRARARSLPTDGSMDGIYSIAVNPVDRAGNSLDTDVRNPQRRGQYFGLQPRNDTTIDLTQFFFLYDNIPPKLEVDDFPDGVVLASGTGRAKAEGPILSEAHFQVATRVPEGPFIGARGFRITGAVADLSAQGQAFGSANSNHRGGSGIDRVEYTLQVVDGQFLPIPSIAPQPGDKEGEIIPGRSNPVIPLTTAILDPIQDPANDPTRSTTNPLDASFASTLRESRRFVIEDTLPADDRILRPSDAPDGTEAFYLFTIRAIDRAGNVTELRRRIQVDTDDVRPPTSFTPADGSFLNASAVTFEWNAIQNITTYEFALNFPDGRDPFVRRVTTNQFQLNLPVEGEYTWTVRSIDQVGNVGSASRTNRLTLDRTAPTLVGAPQIRGQVQPSQNSGVISIGRFTVRLEMSEILARAPAVSFDPAGIELGPLPITTTTLSGNVWEGEAEIPRSARPALWDGRANLIISGARDRAGNPLSAEDQVTVDAFEIDTGPAYDVRFFISPISPQELTLVIVATEDLQAPPRVTSLVNLEKIGDETFRIGASDRAFHSTFRIQNLNVDQDAQVTISGTDLQGNTAERDVGFRIVRVAPREGRRVVSPSGKVALDIPAEAVPAQASIFLFPPVGDGASQVSGEAKAVGFQGKTLPRPTSPGLIDLAGLYDLQARGLDTSAGLPIEARADVPEGRLGERAGLYVGVNGRWRWVGPAVRPGVFSGRLTELGPLRIMADLEPPVVSDIEPEDGEALETPRPTISALVREAGSGIDPGGVVMKIDGATVPARYDESSGEVSWTPSADLTPGEHSVTLEVTDRAGNVSAAMKVELVAPDGFGFASPVLAYPSPARVVARLRMRLTQAAMTQSIRIDIYDAAGERVTTLSPPGPYAAQTDAVWDLTDRDGRDVSSGVYYYRVRAVSASGARAKSRGRLAVLR